jgi:putative NIF3 family GTP cyclohydrolase 1 type 2
MYLSRRRFVALTASGVAGVPLLARGIGGRVTAQDVVNRIKENIGVEWRSSTVDTFKAGDPSTVVTRIVTTSLASLEVLHRAVESGANLIITSEPTFYSKADTSTPPVKRSFGQAPTEPLPSVSDPVFSGKDAFLKKHQIVVFRLSDHWRLREPDPFAQGLADGLGWSKRAGDTKAISIPEISLARLVSHTKKALQSRGGIRVVGNPLSRMRMVGLLPGSTPLQASLAMLPGVDAIIAGEVREWETVEYVRDTDDLGGKKALILTGRIVSEDPGMRLCAQWLKAIVPEVPATWISAGDPYWRPDPRSAS